MHSAIKAMMDVQMHVVCGDGMATVVHLSEQDARRVLRRALSAVGIDDKTVRKVGLYGLQRAAWPGGRVGDDLRCTLPESARQTLTDSGEASRD